MPLVLLVEHGEFHALELVLHPKVAVDAGLLMRADVLFPTLNEPVGLVIDESAEFRAGNDLCDSVSPFSLTGEL